MGITHMLEHMVFKGTGGRTPRQIALALESLGGSLDAYTSREHTSFQARVLDAHVPEALDVLTDLVRRPRLRGADLEVEREVVLEEIAQVEDTPDDLVHELHGARLWGGHPYGHHILGTRDTVAGFTAADLREVHVERYVGANMVVAAAGNVEHDGFVSRVRDHLGDLPAGTPTPPVPTPPVAPRGRVVVERDTTQAHLVSGTPGVPHHHEMRIPLILLSQAFGGGMSSRLFQRIREELGLVYTVFSFQSFYRRSGIAGVYLGTRPEWLGHAEEALLEEYGRLADEGLGREETAQVRRQVKGQIMLSLESTSARLYRLAGFALHDEQWLDLDGLLARVEAVTDDQLREAAATWFDPERQLRLVLGPGGGGGTG
jgi:predicted Zn-dependent peptidase